MPNWCLNQVTFTAFDQETIDNDLEEIHGIFNNPEVGVFEHFIPVNSKDIDDQREAWGTKWDIMPKEDIRNISQSNNSVTFEFYTAWGPPEPVYNAIKNEYPNLSIHYVYDEPGWGIKGEGEI